MIVCAVTNPGWSSNFTCTLVCIGAVNGNGR